VLPWSSNLRRSTVEPSWRGSLQTSMPVACRSCEEAGSYGGHLETASVPSVDWGLHPALPARTCSGYSTLCRILDRRNGVRPVRLPQDNRCAVADRQPLKGSRQIRWRAGQSQKKAAVRRPEVQGGKRPRRAQQGDANRSVAVLRTLIARALDLPPTGGTAGPIGRVEPFRDEPLKPHRAGMPEERRAPNPRYCGKHQRIGAAVEQAGTDFSMISSPIRAPSSGSFAMSSGILLVVLAGDAGAVGACRLRSRRAGEWAPTGSSPLPAFAIPDKRRRLRIPASRRLLEPAPDLLRAVRVLSSERAALEHALDRLGHVEPTAAHGRVERHDAMRTQL
jgi:hypothetical protein